MFHERLLGEIGSVSRNVSESISTSSEVYTHIHPSMWYTAEHFFVTHKRSRSLSSQVFVLLWSKVLE